MTVPTGTKANLDQAFHTLTHPGHPRHKVETRSGEREHDERKHLHVHELHDGTFHLELDHGSEGEMETASADDLDGVHDHLEEHFGGPPSAEEQNEEHAGHEEHSRY